MRMKLHNYIKALDEGTEKIDINYILFFQNSQLLRIAYQKFLHGFFSCKIF